MAGNVWEWTGTKWIANYKNYANLVANDQEGDVARALRGGAWNNLSDGVRSANRNLYYPNYRGNGIGFRLVVLIPVG